jgi:hypothetical protein
MTFLFTSTKITLNFVATGDIILMWGERERESAGGEEGAYLLSLICVIKPSIVVTSPPRVPLPNSKSSSGTFTLAVSD